MHVTVNFIQPKQKGTRILYVHIMCSRYGTYKGRSLLVTAIRYIITLRDTRNFTDERLIEIKTVVKKIFPIRP